MSSPNLNFSNLDSRYSKPADVAAAISAQATTDASKYAPQSQVPRLASSQLVKNMVTNILTATPSPPVVSFSSTATLSGAGYTTTNPTATNNYGQSPADTTAYGTIKLGGAPIINSANGAVYAAPRYPIALNSAYAYAPRMTVEFDTEADQFEVQSGSPGGGIFLCHRIYVNEQPITVPRRLPTCAFLSGSPIVVVPGGTSGILPYELLSHPYLNSTGVYVATVGGTLATLSASWSSGTSVAVAALTYGIPQGAVVTAGGQTFTLAAAAAAGATSITVTAAPSSTINSGTNLAGTNTLTLAGAGNGSSGTTAVASGTPIRTYGLLYGTQKFVKVSFGSRSSIPRRIFWEICNPQTSSYPGAWYLSTIARPTTATLAPPRIKTARAVVLHDSYGSGVDGQDFSYGSGGLQWSLIALRALGINDIITSTSISSTGICQSSSAYGTYNARLSDVYEMAPQLVLYCGSINDPSNGQTPAAVQAQAVTDLNAILTNLPTAIVVVTGLLFPGNPKTNYAATDTALAAAVTAVNNPRCQFFSFINRTPSPFFGTGYVGATTGDGPADYLLGADGGHPSPMPSPTNSGNYNDQGGHYAIGMQVAQAIAPFLNLTV